jgi:hypothetical protein
MRSAKENEMTRAEMAALIRKVSKESREVVAPFETFAFKRVELGDLDHIASKANGTILHNAMALDHIASLLEGEEE